MLLAPVAPALAFLLFPAIFYVPIYLGGLAFGADAGVPGWNRAELMASASSVKYAVVFFWIFAVLAACWYRALITALAALAGGITGWLAFLLLEALHGLSQSASGWMVYFYWIVIAVAAIAGPVGVLVVVGSVILGLSKGLRPLLRFLDKVLPLLLIPVWLVLLVWPWFSMVPARIHELLEGIFPMSSTNIWILSAYSAVFLLSFFITAHPEYNFTNWLFREAKNLRPANARTFVNWIPLVRPDGGFFWWIGSAVCLIFCIDAARRLHLPDLPVIFSAGMAGQWASVSVGNWGGLGVLCLGAVCSAAMPVRFLRFTVLGVTFFAWMGVVRWLIESLPSPQSANLWMALGGVVVTMAVAFLGIREIGLWQAVVDRFLEKLRPGFLLRAVALVVFTMVLSALAKLPAAGEGADSLVAAIPLIVCLGAGIALTRYPATGERFTGLPLLDFLRRILSWPLGLLLRRLQAIREAREEARRLEEIRRQRELEEARRREEALAKEREFQRLLAEGKIRETCTEPLKIVYHCKSCGNFSPGEKWAEADECPDCGEESKGLREVNSSKCATCGLDCLPEPGSRNCHSIRIYKEQAKLLKFQATATEKL